MLHKRHTPPSLMGTVAPQARSVFARAPESEELSRQGTRRAGQCRQASRSRQARKPMHRSSAASTHIVRSIISKESVKALNPQALHAPIPIHATATVLTGVSYTLSLLVVNPVCAIKVATPSPCVTHTTLESGKRERMRVNAARYLRTATSWVSVRSPNPNYIF